MSSLDFLKADAAVKEEFGGSALERLQLLVNEYDTLADKIERAEQVLKELQTAFNKVSMEEIPSLLGGAGLSEIRLADGRKVTVKAEISASVTDPGAFAQYVTDRGDDYLLKTTMELGKLPDNVLSALRKLLATELELYPEIKQSVHPQTLKKYIREITGAGKEDPEAALGDRYVPVHELPESVSIFNYFKTTIKKS